MSLTILGDTCVSLTILGDTRVSLAILGAHMSLTILGDTRVTVLSKQHLPPSHLSPHFLHGRHHYLTNSVFPASLWSLTITHQQGTS